jgi:hypothetical protein
MSLWKTLNARWGSGAGEIDEVRIDASTNSLQTIGYEHHEIHSGSSYFTEGHATLDDQDVPANGNLYASFVTPTGAKWGHFTWTVTSNGILDVKMYEGSSGGMAGGVRGVVHAHNRNKNCWWGIHDGGDGQAVCSDGSQSYTPDALIGMQIFNQTDGSSSFITDNDGTDVTGVLAGGAENDWDNGDVFEINNSQMVVTVGHAVPTTLGLLIADTAFGGTGFKADVGGGTTRSQEIIARANTTYVMHIESGTDASIVTFNLNWYEHSDKH